jgi:hypothetical protein
VTSDGGLLLVRELDERLGLGELIERHLTDGQTEPQAGDPVQNLFYQAASWTKARCVVAKVEFHFGELFPRVGVIVTNLTPSNWAVVRLYNKCGTAEQ